MKNEDYHSAERKADRTVTVDVLVIAAVAVCVIFIISMATGGAA